MSASDHRWKVSSSGMTLAGFDDSYWPLLVIYVPNGIDVEDIAPLFREWERFCLERGAHVASFDMRDFNPLSALGPIRRVAAIEVEAGMPIYEKHLLGVTRLVEHPITRALLRAFDWMLPLPWPTCNTESVVVGEAWLRERATECGLSLPTSFDLDALRGREKARVRRAS